jgi:hypothetical protein
MLAGFHPLKPEENHSVVHTLKIRRSGQHTLWVRYLAGPYAGKFTVALRQGGAIVAKQEIEENAAKHGTGYATGSYLPKSFRAELRDFLAWPARLGGASRVAAADCPIAEIVRYDGPERAMVFVIDHRAEPAGRFTFDLFDAAGWTRAMAASGARVELAPSAGGVLRISLPLSAADAVVLSKSDAR